MQSTPHIKVHPNARLIDGYKTSQHPMRKVWSCMKNRCYNKHAHNYRFYGGAGIKVCDRWRKSFAAFVSDLPKRPSMDHTLDRINTDGDYEPGNCRWATKLQQARNSKCNKVISFNGESMCVAAWAEKTGIAKDVLYQRLNRLGWTVERALTIPTQFQK